MDGKYDNIAGGNICQQGAADSMSLRQALRLMRVIVRKGGGRLGQPKRGPEVRPATASARHDAKTQPKVGRQRHRREAPAKAKSSACKVLDKKKQPAAAAKARAPTVRVTRGGGAPKEKRCFELGRPGPDPQTRQASKLSTPVPRDTN